MKVKELRRLIKEALAEESAPVDIKKAFNMINSAFKNGSEVMVKGKSIAKIVAPAGVLIAKDATVFKIKDLKASDVTIDGNNVTFPKITPRPTPSTLPSSMPTGATNMGYGGTGYGKFGQFYAGD